MDEMDKAVLFSVNNNIDSTDFLTETEIKEGVKKLKLLHINGDINTKEDVFAYTHKIAENIDVLGTDKDVDSISENFNLMMRILSESYDYIILDVKSGFDRISLNAISRSVVTVVCLPQDKYICEDFICSEYLLKDRKSIFLISQYDDKMAFKKSDIEVVIQREVYAINSDIKINSSCYDRKIYSFINSKKTNNSELDNLYNEIERLINIDELNITYKIDNRSRKKESINVEKSIDNPVKVVKEYKFIKKHLSKKYLRSYKLIIWSWSYICYS